MGKSLDKSSRRIIILIILFISSFSLVNELCLKEYNIKEKWFEDFLIKRTEKLDINEILLLQFSTEEDINEMFSFIDTTDTEEVCFKELPTEEIHEDIQYTNNKPKVSYDSVKSVILIRIDKRRLDWFSDKQGIIKLNDKEIVILGYIPKEILEYNGRDTCFDIPKKNIFVRYEPIKEFYLIKDTVLEFSFRF